MFKVNNKDITTSLLLLTLNMFYIFSWYLGKYCRLSLPAEIKEQKSKNAIWKTRYRHLGIGIAIGIQI